MSCHKENKSVSLEEMDQHAESVRSTWNYQQVPYQIVSHILLHLPHPRDCWINHIFPLSFRPFFSLVSSRICISTMKNVEYHCTGPPDGFTYIQLLERQPTPAGSLHVFHCPIGDEGLEYSISWDDVKSILESHLVTLGNLQVLCPRDSPPEAYAKSIRSSLGIRRLYTDQQHQW